MTSSSYKPAPAGYRWIFTAKFRHWRSGKTLYARDYGRACWAFLVRA